MAKLGWRINKPYYLFRPSQVGRRVASACRRRLPELQPVRLPWGLTLWVRPDEQIGRCVVRRGVFDLAVSETLYRLADPGEVAVDVGANVGHMTSLLVLRVGDRGGVLAFEPHPQIVELLRRNVEGWSSQPGLGAVEIHELALSDRSGHGTLAMKAAFEGNMGSAAIARDADALAVAAHLHQVALRPLDDVLGDRFVGALKVDVEGHELQVLQGASRALGDHRIRDIVFEEFEPPPTPVTELLAGHGYTLFSLDQTLAGPVIGPISAGSARRSFEDPSYLATTDPGRAAARLRRRGWSVLRRQDRRQAV